MTRVALLVNFVAPYRLSLFEALQQRVGTLRVLASTSMEPNRPWPVNWGTLDVCQQRTITVRKRWRDITGFKDIGYVHFPYDTFAQLRRFVPDTIISSEMGLRTVLAAIYKRLHPHVRLVVWATISEHTERSRGRLRSLLRPMLLRHADAVLVNGASGQRYVSSLGVPDDRIVRVPYTIEVSAFRSTSARPAASDVARLLFTGMLVERKGLLPFLSVLCAWAADHPDRAVEFTIVGDGPLKPAIEQVKTPLNLTLHLQSTVSYDRLPPLYQAAQLYVLPTLADEWGVVVNEAMAAGLPVLGSRHSQAVEELVTDGETGWMFTPDDPRTVYQAIDRALSSSPDTWRRMSEAARVVASN